MHELWTIFSDPFGVSSGDNESPGRMSSTSLSLAESKELLKLCSQGKLYEVANWIASGRPIHVAEDAKETPLLVALNLGFHSLVELLVRNLANQSEKDAALKKAVKLRRIDLIELLVLHGADALSVPFADVLCEWNPEVIRFFVSKDADVVTGAPFAEAFKHKIRTAIGPYLEVKRARPELASELQEQADRALRWFAYEGNLKWVSLLMWAGANPRSKGPSLHDWSDETDSESFTNAIDEACSTGRLDVVKKLNIDPDADDLGQALSCAGWSCDEHLLKYLLELGISPNDKANGGSRALDRCLQKFSFGSWRGGSFRLLTRKWELHSHFSCVQQLIKHNARWVPDDDYDIKGLRRHLLKCDPEVTTELLTLLMSNGGCSEELARKLLSTAKMKSHMASQEMQLKRKGLSRLAPVRRKAKCTQDNARKNSHISYRLLSKYSRETLYHEVWEQPMKVLCAKYGISDVALAKVCRKLLVPIPGRGYWAKKSAGCKLKERPKLPMVADGIMP